MQIVKDNVGYVIVAVLVGIVFVLRNKGFLTADDALYLLGGMSPVTGAVFHRMQPPASPPKDPPGGTVTRITIPPAGGAAALVLLALGLSACTVEQLRTANDARNALCDLVGEEQRAQIETEGAKVGLSPADALQVFRDTCQVRVKLGTQGAIGAIGQSAPGGAP